MMNVFEGWNYLYLKVFLVVKKYLFVIEICLVSVWNFSEYFCVFN